MLLFVLGCNSNNIEPRTLTFYTDGAFPEQKKLYDRAKEQFEKEHPGVTVNYVYFNGNTFTTAAYKKGIDDLIQEGNSPDIVSGGPSFFTDLGKEEYLYDINILAKRNDFHLEDYFERPMLTNLTFNQKQLAIPTSVTPMVVFYNKSVFMNAGLPEPTKEWTWDDLADATQKIQKQSGGQKIATVFPYLNATTRSLSNGGSILSPDGLTYKGYLDGERSVEAISWYASKVRDGLFNPLPAPTQDPMIQLQSGSVGMYITYFSTFSVITPENRDNIGIAVLPFFANKSRAIFGTSAGLGILQKSKNPDLALEFLKFITMDRNQISEELFRNVGIGMSKKVIEFNEEDPYLKIKMDSIPYMKKDLHQLKRVGANCAKGYGFPEGIK
jgi:multiple sugar transport system substrate-binding protein